MITLIVCGLIVWTGSHKDEHALFVVLLPFCLAADTYLMAHWS